MTIRKKPKQCHIYSKNIQRILASDYCHIIKKFQGLTRKIFQLFSYSLKGHFLIEKAGKIDMNFNAFL